MKKRGVFFIVVLLVLISLSSVVEATSCFRSLADPARILKPNPTIVVEFGEPVDVKSVVLSSYPLSENGDRDFQNPVDKTNILKKLPSSNNSVLKYNLTQEVSDGDYYTIEVSGTTKEVKDDNGNILKGSITLDDCKLFLVDFGPLEIIQTYPQTNYISKPAEQLVFTTNRRATCKISTTSKKFDTMNVMTETGEYVHKNIHPGTSPFYVTCQDSIGEVSREFNVVLDTTPPLTPVVDDSTTVSINPEKSITTNSLRVKFSSNDTESGISLINFTIVDKTSGINAIPWTTTTFVNEWVVISETSAGDPLRLQDGSEYKVTAYAMNGAGLWSLLGESNGVEIDTAFNPDISSLNVCENGVQDPGETYLDCGGRCPGCVEGHVCSEDGDCRSSFCNPEQNLCVASSCEDGYLNGEEGDVDCGGTCDLLCEVGQSCNSNDDCNVSVCTDGFCVEGSCSDNILNGDETDIDCGGSCSEKCVIGDSCETPFDCESGSCSFSGVCEAKKLSSTSEKKDSLLIPIIISLLILGALGGGGYYAYTNKDILIPMIKNLIGSSGSTPSQQQSTVPQSQVPQSQVPQQSVQQQSAATTISRDLRKKDQERKRNDLFGGFSSGTQASSNASSQEQKDDTVTKKDIDNLFGGMDSI